MPGDGLARGPPAIRKLAALTTGPARSSGIPCAMVLTLIARAPWRPGFLAPSLARVRRARELSLSVGRPGPHAFAVRTGIVRPRSEQRAFDSDTSTASRAQRS
jgi:hypothetical protein